VQDRTERQTGATLSDAAAATRSAGARAVRAYVVAVEE
jgi:predicted amidophosphoribosyltransferase